MEEMAGDNFSTLDVQKWLEMARSNGLEQLAYSYLVEVFGEGKKVILPIITKSAIGQPRCLGISLLHSPNPILIGSRFDVVSWYLLKIILYVGFSDASFVAVGRFV